MKGVAIGVLARDTGPVAVPLARATPSSAAIGADSEHLPRARRQPNQLFHRVAAAGPPQNGKGGAPGDLAVDLHQLEGQPPVGDDGGDTLLRLGEVVKGAALVWMTWIQVAQIRGAARGSAGRTARPGLKPASSRP